MKRLAAYQELLATQGVEWGLIGPREVDRLWDRHIDNCLAVAEDQQCLPPGASVIDVGSGAGLPGLVWALTREDLQVTLVEPQLRRTRFLESAVQELQVTNVQIVRARAQQVRMTADRVTARAVSSTANLVRWLAPLVDADGCMLLMKGERAQQELQEASDWLTRHHWRAELREVGDPPRTRVVIVERT